MNPDPIVTDDVVRKFQEDGATCIRQAFDPHWVSVVEAGVSRNLAEPSDYAGVLKAGESDRGGFLDDYCNWQRIPEYRDFVYASPAGAMTARLMKSRSSVFYHEHLLVKWPGTLKGRPGTTTSPITR